MSKFYSQHYNAIAKEIREQAPGYETRNAENREIRTAAKIREDTLIELALALCFRFKKDNPLFDPVYFLNKCSPDENTMPWGELWEDYERSGR
jgi:hypothetical protein